MVPGAAISIAGITQYTDKAGSVAAALQCSTPRLGTSHRRYLAVCLQE
jgi:hypothetical protein